VASTTAGAAAISANAYGATGATYGVYGNDNSATGYGGYFTNSNGGYALATGSGNVGIGTNTPHAGAALDLGSNTSSLLLPVGTTAQEPGPPVAGMMRYNSTLSKVEYYNGLAWTPFKPSGGPAGSGYFVITQTTYDGNRGGLAGANANCLTELTTNTGWWGYATANAAGLLVAAHVKAFLCDGTTCNNLNASTTYYFGNANDSSAGGGSFTTDASGLGPNDSLPWANADHFGGGFTGSNVGRFWAARSTGSNTAWPAITAPNHCTGWTTNSSGVTAYYGNALAQATSSRWRYTVQGCDQLSPLVCFVNP
jgi:hypothetical protein